MPIRKEMKDRYPKNWKAIRQRILERANNRCEWPGCGVENSSIVVRTIDDKEFGRIEKEVKIVLTIAHIYDMRPECCEDWNLKALCQKHHNALDAKYRANGRRQRRHQQLADRDLI